MLCNYLFCRLFQCSVPMVLAPPYAGDGIAGINEWAEDLIARLESNRSLYRERLEEKSAFVTTMNERLSGLHVFDVPHMLALIEEMEQLYQQTGLGDEAPTGELEEGAPPLTAEEIIASMQDLTATLFSRSDLLQTTERDDLFAMNMAAYAIFEGILISCDEFGIFSYARDQDRMTHLYRNPRFPVDVQELTDTLNMHRIVEYKTQLEEYTHIIDELLKKFSGNIYIYTNIEKIIEYFFDILAYSYLDSYTHLLRNEHVKYIIHEKKASDVFAASLIHFFSNIEFARISAAAFFNADTMGILAKIAGQYATIKRHAQQSCWQKDNSAVFEKKIQHIWKRHKEFEDHADVLHFIATSDDPELKNLYKNFGKAKTKKMVTHVLRAYHAVRGLPGFRKRSRGKAVV